VLVLAAVMVASFFLLRTGVHWAADRARARLEERLPTDLSARERERFLEDLESFFQRAGKAKDPAPLVGGFLERVGKVLEDGKVTRAEVVTLDRFLRESAGSPAPAP